MVCYTYCAGDGESCGWMMHGDIFCFGALARQPATSTTSNFLSFHVSLQIFWDDKNHSVDVIRNALTSLLSFLCTYFMQGRSIYFALGSVFDIHRTFHLAILVNTSFVFVQAVCGLYLLIYLKKSKLISL
jgi:hypothetical protein